MDKILLETCLKTKNPFRRKYLLISENNLSIESRPLTDLYDGECDEPTYINKFCKMAFDYGDIILDLENGKIYSAEQTWDGWQVNKEIADFPVLIF